MKRWWLFAAVLLAGCQSGPPVRPGEAPAGSIVRINGAGATFPYPIYAKWFDEYHKINPKAQINYQSIGSGGGIRQLQAGTVDFGASDSPMTDEQLAQAKTKILHFPTVLGAVVPTYNVPGVTQELKFTPEALAGIFLGTIRRWNDPALNEANPASQSARRRHRRRASLRRQRHHVRVDGLSLQGQRRAGRQDRRRHLRELAGGAGRQGQ